MLEHAIWGFISHRHLCQQKPVVPTPTGKKFNIAEGNSLKHLYQYSQKYFILSILLHSHFSLFVNISGGKKKSLLPRTAVKCIALKNLAYSPVSTSGMGG